MAQQQSGDLRSQCEAVVARSAADGALRRRLLADPGAALREAGVALPAGVRVKAVENAADLVHLVLPPVSGVGELSEEDLGGAAGGGAHHRLGIPSDG